MTDAYPYAENGPDGWTVWEAAARPGPNRMGCCDCGLVHEIEFRASRVTRVEGNRTFVEDLPADQYRVEFRVRRNDAETERLRAVMAAEGRPLAMPFCAVPRSPEELAELDVTLAECMADQGA